jgi:hypothetical protein
MNVFQKVGAIVVVACLAGPAWAQDPAAAPRRTTKPKPKPTEVQVIVRDVSGRPLENVLVNVSGGGGAESTTSTEGIVSFHLTAGSYRLRFEHDEFITLERDVTIRASAKPTEIAVALNRAPPAPEPVAPPPPAPEPRLAPSGPPVNISIPDFVDKSFVGRDPLKESILSCMPDASARLLQLRDPVPDHTHSDVDEVLYVVAGDGALRIGDRVVPVSPGSMSAIPRGTSHGIERRGRNPLIVLSTMAGAPCPVGTTGANTR